jgi:hypothetical protein
VFIVVASRNTSETQDATVSRMLVAQTFGQFMYFLNPLLGADEVMRSCGSLSLPFMMKVMTIETHTL